MPIILGPDGPSLGGFVCPLVVIQADLWKVGQLAPGDTVRFELVSDAAAISAERAQDQLISELKSPPPVAAPPVTGALFDPILGVIEPTGHRPRVVYRRQGDRHLLVEYGSIVLDLELRLRIHALMLELQSMALPGIIDITPGIRSLQVHFDSRVLAQQRLLQALTEAEDRLGGLDDFEIPSRVVHLPLSWKDPAIYETIDKYMASVRDDAPWCPDNIEFIRRINGLASEDDVRRIVFDARYLVMGLGDVYLGAPVATPIDPRHRLVTTKYNPARTWTPENAVGIGGAYLCVYGMEGPGGYQFVGRTLQMWNRWRQTAEFTGGRPWLLRFFDQVRFFPVSTSELQTLRADFLHGRYRLDIREDRFRLADYRRFLADNADGIAAFRSTQRQAFAAERERWAQSGQANWVSDAAIADAGSDSEVDLPQGSRLVTSHVAGSVWKVLVEPEQAVKAGEVLCILESMKMEISVAAPADGVVDRLLCREGGAVSAGQNLLVLTEN
ncbi:kinase A inhibitor [mine drainage metagenome]|uniref:Kinase A inhibitor n=1 Tax=mine drainage metagenome TaxID=410659 RepID=A0A1J5PEJ6_9ZZZZ